MYNNKYAIMYTIAEQVYVIKKSNTFESLLTTRQYLERINSFSHAALSFYNVKMSLILNNSD